MTNQYLIIGQGNIGFALTNQLAKRNEPIITVSRTTKSYQHNHVVHLQMDARKLYQVADCLSQITHVVIIVSPGFDVGDRVIAYQNSYVKICQTVTKMADKLPNVRQVLFVSSTSVYGENAGEWINEHSPIHPNSPTARALYDAERVIVHGFGDKAVIVRPSGIYGKNTERMIRLAKNAHMTGVPCAHYTNRIMDVDLVSVLARIVTCDVPKNEYLVTDFLPASSLDVMTFICQKLNISLPAMSGATPTGKRIVPNIPFEWLSFPDYRVGYAWILESWGLKQERDE